MSLREAVNFALLSPIVFGTREIVSGKVWEYITALRCEFQIQNFTDHRENGKIIKLFKKLRSGITELQLTEELAWTILRDCTRLQSDRDNQSRYELYHGLNYYIARVMGKIVYSQLRDE